MVLGPGLAGPVGVALVNDAGQEITERRSTGPVGNPTGANGASELVEVVGCHDDPDAAVADLEIAVGRPSLVAEGSGDDLGHPFVALEPGRGRKILGPNRRVGDQVGQHRLDDGLLTERGEHGCDVAEKGPVGTENEHSRACQGVVAEEEECRPVEADGGLARARPSLDGQDSGHRGADDDVLLGLDRGHDVEHLARAAPFELGQQGITAPDPRTFVVGVDGIGAEQIVGHLHELAALDDELAAPGDAERVLDGRSVERNGDGRAPLDDHWVAVCVFDVATPHVPRLARFGVEATEAERSQRVAELEHSPLERGQEVRIFGRGGQQAGGALPHRLEALVRPIDVGLFPVEFGIGGGRHGVEHATDAAEPTQRGKTVGVALDKYQSMRDFGRTEEPSGSDDPERSPFEVGGTPRFVVQEHHATALHWDFRLEKNGVLVSWAVPKGLPPDPRANHLAVQTEDHPLSYIDFEGGIPRGEYGGGSVTVWDRGTYTEEKFSDREVMVVLHGERTTGRHVLFKTDGRNWMIHRMDPAADPTRELTPRDARPIEPVAGPRPDGGQWRFGVAWPGMRVAVTVDGGRCTARTSHGKDVTKRWPELGLFGRAVGALPVVFTGVLVRPAPKAEATFFIEDIAWLDGHSATSLPFGRRRALLDDLGLDGSSWKVSPLYDDLDVLFPAAQAQGAGVLGFDDDATTEAPRLIVAD